MLADAACAAICQWTKHKMPVTLCSASTLAGRLSRKPGKLPLLDAGDKYVLPKPEGEIPGACNIP